MIHRPTSDPEDAPVGRGDMLISQLEAMLFVADEPLSARRLSELLEAETADVKEAMDRLRERYAGPQRGVHLVEIAGGFRLLTNPLCAEALAVLAGRRAKDRLSAAALETLAIVAYRQPVSRAEIERIRGVGAGPVLRHLIELELIRVAGREEGLGRALLYGTTRQFLDRFGLKSVKDLPASLEL
jgi:segregation and condensation protein B